MLEYKKNCICKNLRNGHAKSVDIADWTTGPYVSLTMEVGGITAHAEDNAYASIRFCPFCGREFKQKEENK